MWGGVSVKKNSVKNLLYPYVHEIPKEVIIIKSNFNAVRSILKSMIQEIFFIRVIMIMNYTSLDSASFRLSKDVFWIFQSI